MIYHTTKANKGSKSDPKRNQISPGNSRIQKFQSIILQQIASHRSQLERRQHPLLSPVCLYKVKQWPKDRCDSSQMSRGLPEGCRRAPSILHYVPLHHRFIEFRVFSDKSFQILYDKHYQVGFVYDRCKIFVWHTSKACRRPVSTKEAELPDLIITLLLLRSHRRITFKLISKKGPVVAYVDNKTLLQNSTNTTTSWIPEVMHLCRDHINEKLVCITCLIESKFNPSDAKTMNTPIHALINIIRSNKHVVRSKSVSMLQQSINYKAFFIPASSVLMQSDITRTEQTQPDSVRPSWFPASPASLHSNTHQATSYASTDAMNPHSTLDTNHRDCKESSDDDHPQTQNHSSSRPVRKGRGTSNVVRPATFMARNLNSAV